MVLPPEVIAPEEIFPVKALNLAKTFIQKCE
jgi:hypothetical protein